ncbi:AbfB domain-containing protein [Streptomyces sp. NPDC004542]|uniref:AbfB domain-containing protein n=1 Tax=Streptomyces sp. NPDC004542 TaxID=3154281 RepID=UPI0033AE3D19
MQETTPQPPRNEPWENGWAPDTSRAPGTRRLWLAGGLAVATIVACVTAISVHQRGPEEPSPQAATSADADDDGPGLLSFASPSASTKAAPGTKSLPSSATPTPAPPPTASTTSPDHGGGGSKAPAEPSKSPRPTASSGKPDSGGGSHGSDTSSAWRSVQSVNYPDRYWHLSGGYVKLDRIGSASARRDATFKVVKGLADASCFSFVTADGTYLRHSYFVLRSASNDGSALFQRDATFCARPSSVYGAVMLESVNYPGRFLRHQNFQLKLDRYRYGGLYQADSAFRFVDGLA